MKSIFKEENKGLISIINAKLVVQNISRKLTKDKNSTYFFENLLSNIEKYDAMNNYEMRTFEKDVKDHREVLHLMQKAMESISGIKNKKADEIIKCCRVFPDNIGKRTMKLLGFVPLLDTFYKKIKYEEYRRKKIDTEFKLGGKTFLDIKEEELWSEEFPDDDCFIDYKKRNKKIEEILRRYESEEKEKIDCQIKWMIDQIRNKTRTEEDNLVVIGMIQWEQSRANKELLFDLLKEASQAILKNIKNTDDKERK